MAACGSLQRIFEPENPSSLMENLSSSWKPIPPLKPPSDHSFTEIFSELHFEENSNSNSNSKPDPKSPLSPAFAIETSESTPEANIHDCDDRWAGSSHTRSESLNSESLQLCTEGLGFESMDDAEDVKIETLDNSNNNQYRKMREGVNVREQYRKAKNTNKTFPPPISCIGTTGKPWVCFVSYRGDGRLLIREVRIPSQEFLHACREDGRLRLWIDLASDSEDNDDDDDDDAEESEHTVRERERREGEEEEEESRIKDDFERGNL